MDKEKIQKVITGLFLVILLLTSCQSRNDSGLKCGLDAKLEEEKVCVLLDTSLFILYWAKWKESEEETHLQINEL